MVNVCVVMGCSSNNDKKNVIFHRFPSAISKITRSAKSATIADQEKYKELSSKRLKAWNTALKLEDNDDVVVKNHLICSKHFVSGKPADLYDMESPDWIPSLNLGYSLSKLRIKRKLPQDITKRVEEPLKKHLAVETAETTARLARKKSEVNVGRRGRLPSKVILKNRESSSSETESSSSSSSSSSSDSSDSSSDSSDNNANSFAIVAPSFVKNLNNRQLHTKQRKRHQQLIQEALAHSARLSTGVQSKDTGDISSKSSTGENSGTRRNSRLDKEFRISKSTQTELTWGNNPLDQMFGNPKLGFFYVIINNENVQ